MTRILVVDDDPEVISVLTGMLENTFDVVGFTDPNQALARITAGGIDCMVTDLLMPDVDGFTVILKARRAAPHLPVVLISAYIDEEDPTCTQVLRRYTDCVLAKPVEREALVAAIRQACQNKEPGRPEARSN